MSNLFALLTFDINPNKHLIMAADFNLFFNPKLDAAGGNPTLKRKSSAKLIELKEAFNLCDIWRRIRNTKAKRCTFTQQHTSRFIQRRLDYLLISNGFQQAYPQQIFWLSYFNISIDDSPVWFPLFQREKLILEVKPSGNSISP